jgi:hypothetical protein
VPTGREIERFARSAALPLGIAIVAVGELPSDGETLPVAGERGLALTCELPAGVAR